MVITNGRLCFMFLVKVDEARRRSTLKILTFYVYIWMRLDKIRKHVMELQKTTYFKEANINILVQYGVKI